MSTPGRIQFSIRMLLAATAMIAAGIAAVRAEPSLSTAVAIDGLTVIFTTASIVGISHARGKMRTFWIGTTVMLGCATVLASHSFWSILLYAGGKSATGAPGAFVNSYLLAPRTLWAVWCAAPLNGMLAVFMHWLFASPARRKDFQTKTAKARHPTFWLGGE